MKKEKKIMRYSDRVKIEKILMGVIWLATGVLSCFEGIVSLVMEAIAMIICIFALLKVSFAKKENADEMAEQNMNRAKAYALDLTLIVYSSLALAAMLFLDHVELPISFGTLVSAVVFIVLGANQLIIGFAFRKFEDE